MNGIVTEENLMDVARAAAGKIGTKSREDIISMCVLKILEDHMNQPVITTVRWVRAYVLRQLHKRSAKEVPCDFVTKCMSPGFVMSNESILDDEEHCELILSKLGRRESELLRMRYLMGMGYKEMSEIIGTTRWGATYLTNIALEKALVAGKLLN